MDLPNGSRSFLEAFAQSLPSPREHSTPPGLEDWQLELLQAFTMANPVLVTDDDEMSRQYYRSLMVETCGLRLVDTWDPNDALRLCQTQPISLVISCIVKTTPMNGLDFISNLRTLPQTHNIPVLLISASADIHEIAEQAGADSYLTKPCHPNDILQEIWLLLQERLH